PIKGKIRPSLREVATQVNVANEVELVPNLGISADLRSIKPLVDALGARHEQQVEVDLEWYRIIRTMDESDPARLEAVIHVVDGPQRITHVFERVDRERHIELFGQVELLARGTDELQLDPFRLTELEYPSLQFTKEVEFGTQRFDGCHVQPLAR